MADPAYAPDTRVSFVDGYPVLVVSEASVREVSGRVGRDIPVERFRPNIVVTSDDAHEEDGWLRFTLGSAGFQGVKQCARCRVPTVDQQTGAVEPDGEPIRSLATYRKWSGAVWFGLNAVAEAGCEVEVGDALRVLQRGKVPAPRPA